MYELEINKCKYPFNEKEVLTYENFCDPEKEDILNLGLGMHIILDDNAKVTRTE